jgi:hypothetical protein
MKIVFLSLMRTRSAEPRKVQVDTVANDLQRPRMDMPAFDGALFTDRTGCIGKIGPHSVQNRLPPFGFGVLKVSKTALFGGFSPVFASCKQNTPERPIYPLWFFG